MGRRSRSTVHGVLIVDKPKGPTSHDVVQTVRRALRTRAVGHAGTLDPMATGILVVAVGEGTKLVRWLTADDKEYLTTIALGAETDTLDAEGEVVERISAEGVDLARAREAAQRFVGTYGQRPPMFSAIRIDGERSHERARRGEVVEMPEREVSVRDIHVIEADQDHIELTVSSAKGFYVRSLGRDLARALGTRGHLSALRRTRSGAFGLEGAVSHELIVKAKEDDAARATLEGHLLDLAAACSGMPQVTLDARAIEDARHGRPVRVDVSHLALDAAPVALLDDAGALVAVGRRAEDHLQVVRGIRV